MTDKASSAESPVVGPPQRRGNPFPGETLDSDGHVYIHPEVFREIFPELSFGYNFEFLDGYVKHPEFKERRERNREELWETKGLGALGAYDPDERVEALDMMGIKAQLMFANNTLYDLRATTRPRATPASATTTTLSTSPDGRRVAAAPSVTSTPATSTSRSPRRSA